jgi:YfiH family protein
MYRKSKDGVQWLEFEILSRIPTLVHGVFLRQAGKADDFSLNMGSHAADQSERIQHNREKACAVLGIPEAVASRQIHSDRVIHMVRPYLDDLEEADGLMTQEAHLGLMIQHADCQAAIFYDPVHQAVANIHSGWRGQVKNIYAKTVMRMRQVFNSSPKELLVCISPSLGPLHAEFTNYQEDFPESFWAFQVAPGYFDLWAIAKMQLQNCGILPAHIEVASICTYATPEDFFSYRRDKSIGRNATIAAIKP